MCSHRTTSVELKFRASPKDSGAADSTAAIDTVKSRPEGLLKVASPRSTSGSQSDRDLRLSLVFGVSVRHWIYSIGSGDPGTPPHVLLGPSPPRHQPHGHHTILEQIVPHITRSNTTLHLNPSPLPQELLSALQSAATARRDSLVAQASRTPKTGTHHRDPTRRFPRFPPTALPFAQLVAGPSQGPRPTPTAQRPEAIPARGKEQGSRARADRLHATGHCDIPVAGTRGRDSRERRNETGRQRQRQRGWQTPGWARPACLLVWTALT